jgi:hypothetical protein
MAGIFKGLGQGGRGFLDLPDGPGVCQRNPTVAVLGGLTVLLLVVIAGGGIGLAQKEMEQGGKKPPRED